jgi:hypothetical protein
MINNIVHMIWDYLVFGSGYCNNYWKGSQVDIGGSGTYSWYNWWESKSRDAGYSAYYGILTGNNFFSPQYVCSGYSIKLWNTYGGSVKYFNSSYGRPGLIDLISWSPAVIYYQL